MSISLKNDAGTFSTNLNQSNPTANVNIALPTTSGTMALDAETIVNSNGTAIKYSDGTMICHNRLATIQTANSATGSLFYSSGLSITFPATFISVPSISVGCYDALIGFSWAVISGTPTTTGYISVIMAATTGSNSKPSYIAVGRWK
jgi:hypothetical protein